MVEEEFHEIQLNGKQLVFLFMAGTVAAVVIFLCGLMVGRNLRSPRPDTAVTTAEPVVTDPTRPEATLPPPATAANEGGTPVSAKETLTYPERLEARTPPAENLRTIEEKPPPPATPAPPAAAAATAATVSKTHPEPSGSGYVVQVQAVTTLAEADTIASRLNAKGYPAFVTTTEPGKPRFFRIRVGKYPNRRDAEAIKTKLEKQEQYKPLITR
jgi:cell division septation protein DedD